MVHFSNSLLLNIYNLLSQVCALAKFQLHSIMATTFGVTALQCSNNRKIDLYIIQQVAIAWENK